MAKPIKLTQETMLKYMEEFAEKLRSARMTGGTFEFKKDVKYEGEHTCEVVYSAKAWYKTIMLIAENAKEVGWHGVCRRDDEDPTIFYIDDILVYPQKVTGTTINPDTIEYTAWMNGLDDDTFNNMRCHVHSHVNMGVTPSGTDQTFRKDRLSQLGDNDYYIFQIMNKKGDINSEVYDFKNNILYENKEVKTLVMCECEMEEWDVYKTVGSLLLACNNNGDLQPIFDLFESAGIREFLSTAKESVKEEKYSYGSYYSGGTFASKGTNGQGKTSLPPGSVRTMGQYGCYNKSAQPTDETDDPEDDDVINDPFGYRDELGRYYSGSYSDPCLDGDCDFCSNTSCAYNERYWDRFNGGWGC